MKEKYRGGSIRARIRIKLALHATILRRSFINVLSLLISGVTNFKPDRYKLIAAPLVGEEEK